MQSLIDGYNRFRENYWTQHRELFRTLAQGQSPEAMVIGCCDSRVSPEVIFDAEPGRIFVVRNVANLVPPYHPDKEHHGTSAALEFAVRGLKVRHIIVMGHASCGGIRALMQGEADQSDDFIHNWMQIAAPARERALAESEGRPEAATRLCEHASIQVSLENLMTFPWVKEAVEAGSLQLHGYYYDVENGQLDQL